jgi:hypothetical protein
MATSNALMPVWVCFIQHVSDPSTGVYLCQSPNWNYVHGRAVLAKSRNPELRIVFERSGFLVSQTARIKLDSASVELLALSFDQPALSPLLEDYL